MKTPEIDTSAARRATRLQWYYSMGDYQAEIPAGYVCDPEVGPMFYCPDGGRASLQWCDGLGLWLCEVRSGADYAAGYGYWAEQAMSRAGLKGDCRG